MLPTGPQVCELIADGLYCTIQIVCWLFMKLALFVDEIFIENKIYEDAKNRFDYPPLNCGF